MDSVSDEDNYVTIIFKDYFFPVLKDKIDDLAARRIQNYAVQDSTLKYILVLTPGTHPMYLHLKPLIKNEPEIDIRFSKTKDPLEIKEKNLGEIARYQHCQEVNGQRFTHEETPDDIAERNSNLRKKEIKCINYT